MTDMPASATAPPPAKVDPDALVIRGTPSRVTRFRRGAIIAIAAVLSIAIVVVTWVALKPATLSLVVSDDDRPQRGAAAPPDALAGAPATYGDIPQLGPPLPGDLGRPILSHQREAGATPVNDAADAAHRAAQDAEAERQRLAAERRAARESGVIMQVAGISTKTTPVPSAADQPASPPIDAVAAGSVTPNSERDPIDQPRRIDLVRQSDSGSSINPHEVMPAPSPYTLNAGSVIAASLITGLNSDLPGLVAAQVTENAYDTVTGKILLIPQGSRLIGSYDNVVAFGQRRALVVWQRIILPDGSSIRIENVPVTDAAGYTGLTDQVDRHTWQLLKGVALSTLLGVGTELSFGTSESDLVRAIRESAQQNGSRAGDQLVTRNLGIQPTIRVRPGWPLRIVVNKDIIMRPSHVAGR